jgi:hypothetical protein
LRSRTPQPHIDAASSDTPARRDPGDQSRLLDRILETPQLAQVVPHLKPELLHRVIQRCGLEDCAELVALATPAQLARIFDLDLWRAQSGRDDQFDAARFGVWLEVLMELGATVAARKLADMGVELVTAGVAQHARVFDRATVSSYMTTDGQEVAARTFDDVPTCDIGGYVLVARRGDAWDAIVAALSSLEAEQPEYFHQVMRGCRAVSNSMPERDGLDDLLAGADQIMFDLASGRHQRRGAQGYLSRAEAQAFLQMSRELRLGDDTGPPPNPIARGYFRAIDETRSAAAAEPSGPAPPESDAPSATDESTEAAAALADVVEILQGAGIVAPQPRALLGGSESQAPRLEPIQAHLQDLLEHDRATYEKRNEELAFLSNTILAGCSIQARAFTPQEASDAAVAVCNLGLEHWPGTWGPASAGRSAGPDLITVFQVGWKILYDQVAMYTAERLIGVLADLQCRDRDIQAGLVVLRIEMTKQWQAGSPWRARDALDVLSALDMLAWATLLGLLDECPVIHAALSAAMSSGSTASSGRAGVRAVSATDFEFISGNSQIASVHGFMQSLPGILT